LKPDPFSQHVYSNSVAGIILEIILQYARTENRTRITLVTQPTAKKYGSNPVGRNEFWTAEIQSLCTYHGYDNQWRTDGGVSEVHPPPPEIPKALQNRAKLNPIVKTVKNC